MSVTAISSSWREKIKVHPEADIFPPMAAAELEQLGEDIKKNGLQIPIAFSDERLIDGRNRLDAMERAGIPIFDADGDLDVSSVHVENVDPLLYVVAVNFKRRHLTQKQRYEIVRNVKAQRPDLSIRAIANATRIPKSAVDRALKGSGVPNGTPGSVIGRDGKRYSTERKRSPKPKAPRAQVRDSAIESFCIQLSQKPLDTLEDLGRIL